MLLFVNLQIVIKEHGFIFNAGADVMAQHMQKEPGDNCFDPVYKFYYRSAFTNCYNTVVLSSTSSGASSVEFVQEPSTDEETDDDSVVKKTGTEGKKGEEKKEKIKTIEKDPPGHGFFVELIPIKITLPPIPNVPKYVPVHRLAAIMAALGYSDYKTFAEELQAKGWNIADDEAKMLGLKLHDGSGLDAMLLKSDDGQSYVLVFAGTEISQVGDVEADVYQAVIGYDGQYESARQLALKLNNFFADKNLTFVGHSLGGGLATFASMLTGRYAITFNPAALNLTLLSALTVMGYDCSGEKVYNYIMKGDPVSKANKWIPNTHVGSYVGHRIDVTNYTNGSAHGIKNMVDNFPEDGILYERREYRK